MRLITEEIETYECVSESVNGSKHLFIVGPFLVGDTKNKNNRVYPMNILESKANDYIDKYVKAGRAFGELGHPKGPQINLERVSHIITELTRNGNVYNGKARIVEEGLGKIAHGIVSAGGRLGVSSRAVGSLKALPNGINEVQNDLIISTAADIVVDPSAPGAFVNGIYEQSEWVYQNGMLVEHEIARYKNQVDRVYAGNTRDRQEKLIELFEQFLGDLARS